MVPSFTNFYLPVLEVLKNIETIEVNQLVEKVADLTGLSAEDKSETTKGGKRYRYVSNILWAITDLAQAGCVERPTRGHVVITIDGLSMLDDNPKLPNRDYLYEHYEKFRGFLAKKGTRSRKSNKSQNELPFNEDDNNVINETRVITEDDIEISLKDLYASMRTLRKAKISTTEINEKLSELEEKLIRLKILPLLSQQLTPALSDIERRLVLVVDYNPGEEVKVSLSRRVDLKTAIEAKEIKSINNDLKKPLNSSLRKRRKNSSLKVTMPNGKILSDSSAVEILIYVIEYVGPEKVEKLGIKFAGMPLVSKKKPGKYGFRLLSNRYFLSTNSSTVYKKHFIDQISEAYNLGLKTEIID